MSRNVDGNQNSAEIVRKYVELFNKSCQMLKRVICAKSRILLTLPTMSATAFILLQILMEFIVRTVWRYQSIDTAQSSDKNLFYKSHQIM